MSISIKRRQALLLALAIATPALAADPYPTKPIRVIVNSAPGALLDTTIRAVAQKMSQGLGQPIVVENNTGGGGLIGIRQVKMAAPDGYTLLASAGTVALATVTRLDPGYELKDFAPISAMTTTPYIMVGAVSLPDKTLAELVARAKANPGALDYASGGIGTTTHVAAGLFLGMAGLTMQHVPYRGNASAMPDVIAGRVRFLIDGITTSGPNVREGRLRAYGITSTKRSAVYPEIPTIAEQGYPGYEYIAYNGLLAPAATPKEIVQRLNEAMRNALTSDELRERFRKEGQEASPQTPEEFAAMLRQDAQKTAKMMADFGIAKE
jgi:tripartite-type tricarboxylate transporter receptor subunit TctC